MSECNHEYYSTTPEECDNVTHPEECVVSKCDNCNAELGHDFATNGAVTLFTGPTPDHLSRTKTNNTFNDIVEGDQKASKEETDKKFNDIVSRIQFGEDQ